MMPTGTNLSSPLSSSPTRQQDERTTSDSDGLTAATLTPQQYRDALRNMILSRRIDDREIVLKRQNRIYFQISGAGHEAIQVAAAMALRPGHDWFYPYYRDRALALTLGVSAADMLLGSVGAPDDPASGGRQMPSHWSSPSLHIVTGSSPTGTQFLQAMGCASGSRYINPDSDEITLCTTGDGATSEGEFWEAMNVVCLDKLPVLFVVEDNGYAISVPVERQTAGASISKLLSGFPGLLRLEVDGTDFDASFRAMQQAASYVREQRLPALVHAHCTRPYSHSLSDDEELYKTVDERADEAARDPLVQFPRWLMTHGLLELAEYERIQREVNATVEAATERALRAPAPPRGTT